MQGQNWRCLPLLVIKILNCEKLFHLENGIFWFYDILPLRNMLFFNLNMFLTGMHRILSKIRRNFLLWPSWNLVRREKNKSIIKDDIFLSFSFLSTLCSAFIKVGLRTKERRGQDQQRKENSGKYFLRKRWSDIDCFVWSTFMTNENIHHRSQLKKSAPF